MSYLVLARKYRPRNFTEMVGQSHVVQALSNALSTQRLHHAYLFTGTRGVGKTTIARILAKSLNCQGVDGNGGITATPCGVCQACTDIDAGRFVDYTELDAASNRGVDEVQTLLEQAVYKPVQGRFKVFMIDEVHMLSGHAFNAMLKTLEEPPEYLKFVLATTDPQKVPATVLSRCLQFNLRPMAPETIGEHLQKILHIENVAADAQSLRLIARAARGSMRDALSLADQAISFGAGQLEEMNVRQMLGSVDRSYVFRLLEALVHGDGKSVVETSEALRLNGLSAASTLEEMSAVLQRMAVWQALPNAAAEVDDGDPEVMNIIRLAKAMPADETQLLYSICLHGRTELGLAPDEYAALTMVLLRLLAFKPQTGTREVAEKKTLNDQLVPNLRPATTSKRVSIATPGQQLPVRTIVPVTDQATSSKELLTAIESVPQATRIVAIPVRVQADSRSEAQAVKVAPVLLLPTEEGEFWQCTVQQLIAADAISALVRELALQSQLVARDADQWILRVERESLNQAGCRDRLATALQAAGHAVSLVVEVGRVTDSPARRQASAVAESQLAVEKIIFNDPFVQTMMRDFGAKIVPGSIKQV